MELKSFSTTLVIIYQLALSKDVILNTSVIKRKEKFQFTKVQIFEIKSPTILDSVVDLIDVNILYTRKMHVHFSTVAL
jgi:hypothetical protein